MTRTITLGSLLALVFLIYEVGPDLWRYRQRAIAIEECSRGDCRAWDEQVRRDYR